jgi:Flp pilus assembly secretin CpaC
MKAGFVALGVAILMGPAALAQDSGLRVALDQSAPVVLPGSASGVVVGNPTVAGVSIQNDRLLFVTGRSYGTTNLIVVGANGRPILQTRVTVVPDESGSVMVTKGTDSARFDCTPLCRRRPDLSDSPDAFGKANEQINARTGQAAQGQ